MPTKPASIPGGWSSGAASQLPRFQATYLSAHVDVIERRRRFGKVSTQPIVWVESGGFRAQFHLGDIKRFAAAQGREVTDAMGDAPVFLAGASAAAAGSEFAEELAAGQVVPGSMVIYAPTVDPKMPIIVSSEIAGKFFAWVDSLPS